MKPTQVERGLVEGGEISSTMFGLSERASDQSHILNILRDKLYTNKVLAVIREYSTNAWDAHIDAGCPQTPIHVRLPTPLDPTFIVRDFGKGLAPEDIIHTYTKYGSSTKRDTNAVVGMLGIGSKSGFAYSDSFSVTSYFEGIKRIYVASLDATNMGKMTLHYEGPTKEQGIEIRIPVHPKDTEQFYSEAKALFPFFDPQPVINVELVSLAESAWGAADGWIQRDVPKGLPRWTARMGCVPYRINFENIGELSENDEILLAKHAGCIYLPLGTADVSASREELEYTEKTKLAVREGLLRLRATQSAHVLSLVMACSGIARRLKAIEIAKTTGMSLPKEYLYLESPRAQLCELSDAAFDAQCAELDRNNKPVPRRQTKSFRLLSKVVLNSSAERVEEISSVKVAEFTQLVFNDEPDKARLKHYSDIWRYTVVDPLPGFTKEQVLRELKPLIQTATLDGIQIQDASTVGTYVPRAKGRGGRIVDTLERVRHPYRNRLFKWLNLSDTENSGNWEPTDNAFESHNVYVILKGFRSSTSLVEIRRNKYLLEVLAPHVEFPEIYGIRDLVIDPMSPEKIHAVPYDKWFSNTMKTLMAEDTDLSLTIADSEFFVLLGHPKEMSSIVVAEFCRHLTEGHPLRHYLEVTQRVAKVGNSDGYYADTPKRLYKAYRQQIGNISNNLRRDAINACGELPRFNVSQYPLLPDRPENFLRGLNSFHAAKDMGRYIQLIDLHGA